MPCPCQEPSLSCSLARNATPRSMVSTRRSLGGCASAPDAKRSETITPRSGLMASLLSRWRGGVGQALEVLPNQFGMIGAEAGGVILHHLRLQLAGQLAPILGFV